MNTIQEHYSDEETCRAEISEARQIFGDKTTNRKQFEAMQKALGLMYLYCPKTMMQLVKSTLDESVIRETYFELLFWA